MYSIVAKILFNSNRHCFALLPKSLTYKCSNDKIDVIKVESSTGCLFTSWSGDVTGKQPNGCVDDVVEINGFFASKMGFCNGQEVTVTLLPAVVNCVSAQVEPASVDDWEILEINAEYVESNLLNQVRVVSLGQVFPIWVQRTTCVFVIVGRMEPSVKLSLLQPDTELVISPKSRLPNVQNHRHVSQQTSPNAAADTATPSLKASGAVPEPPCNSNFMPVNDNDIVSDHPSWLQNSTEHDDPSGKSTGFFSYLMSFWSQTGGKTGYAEKPTVQEKLLSREFCASFRVLPLEDFVKTKTKDDFLSGSYKQNGLDLSLQPSNVFVTQESVFSLSCFSMLEHFPETFLARVSKLPSPGEKKEASKSKTKVKYTDEMTSKTKDKLNEIRSSKVTEDVPQSDQITVRVIVMKGSKFFNGLGGRIDLVEEKTLPLGHVLIQSELRRTLGLEKTSRIQMDALMKCSNIIPDEIKLCRLFQAPAGFTDEMLQLAFRQWAEFVTSESCPFLLNHGTFLRCFIKEGFSGEFFVTFGSIESKDRPYCLLNPDLLQSVKLKSISSEKNQLTVESYSEAEEFDFCSSSLGFNQLHVDVTTENAANEYINICLSHCSLPRLLFRRIPGLANGGLLLLGAKGSGKSALGGAICHRAACDPNYAFVEVVDCKALKGKKPETIRQYLEQKFDELSWRQPSVLFLDDLDHITAPSGGPEQEMSGLAAYHARVAEIIEDLIQREGLNGSAIAVLASAISYSTIHPTLVSPRGSHVFTRIVEIKPPNQDDQAEILRHMLKNRKEVSSQCIDNLNLCDIASQMEGFVPKDLEMVISRAIHASLLNSNSNSSGDVVLNDSHFKTALADFIPAALRSVSLVQPEGLSWEDVGGLHEVRSVLIQTLQWPSKYPKLFASCPLRLRSGLLLYGAPGTGKTHLAAVVAKEFKLNFISIKGPELFNKYIGASEQAVRDIFARAQSAKPCILFFDEFDSLAPRRGHDNTGVTDRVVNQLLTQLDGVESLEGVFVLAATSRPDLIDPALLRPGRLDKALHCPIPTKAERLEILQVLSRKMSLSDDVDLEFIANKCQNFTGADFKALLYNAQLEAIHETTTAIIEVSSETEPGLHLSDADTSAVITVTQDHLLRASHDLQPSVSASERHKYRQIYESFVGSRGGNFVADATENVGQHVTLA